ncbi:MAG: phosphatidate cytidylyltransferase [Pirellulales bacterium]|nr:phosphatidate cytidylyltransferase [Pirellulales bacterium]
MLRFRLLFGALFIAALVVLCWLDGVAARPGTFLLPLAVVVGWMGVVELKRMYVQRGWKPNSCVMHSGVLLAVLLSGLPVIWPGVARSVPGQLGWLAIALVAGLLNALVGELRRFDTKRPTTVYLGLEAFSILYLGGLLGFIVQLRALSGGSFGEEGRVGMLALVSLLAIVKMSDTGQYTAGRLFGKHKLAPSISPGKTWEGVAGGALFAIVAAVIVFGWAGPQITGRPGGCAALMADLARLARVTGFAIALTAAGILGDLAESVLKREAGVKDSSAWMPGFGGVLDLLDSLLGAAPVAYLLWAVGFVNA